MQLSKVNNFWHCPSWLYRWGQIFFDHGFYPYPKRSLLRRFRLRSPLLHLAPSTSTPLAIGRLVLFCWKLTYINFKLLIFTSIHFSYRLAEVDRSHLPRHYCHAHALVVTTHLRMAIAQVMLTLIGFEGAIAPDSDNPQLENFAPGVSSPQLHRRNAIASYPCSAWASATADPALVVVMARPAGMAMVSWISRLVSPGVGQWAIAPNNSPILGDAAV